MHLLKRFAVTLVGAALLALGAAMMVLPGILAVTAAILLVTTYMTFRAARGEDTTHTGEHFEVNGPLQMTSVRRRPTSGGSSVVIGWHGSAERAAPPVTRTDSAGGHRFSARRASGAARRGRA